MVERLHLRPELRLYESLIRETSARVAALGRETLARPLDVLRYSGGPLVVESELPAGARLADLLETRPEDYPAPGLDAALIFLVQAFQALAVLHATKTAHGILAPGRIIVTASGRIVLLDAIYAAALERLHLNRRTLWSSFGVAAAPGGAAPRLDARLDVSQAAICAIQLALGRELVTGERDEWLALLQEIADVAHIRGGRRFGDSLDELLRSALGLDGSHPPPADVVGAHAARLAGELGCENGVLGELAGCQPAADAPVRPSPAKRPALTPPPPSVSARPAPIRARESASPVVPSSKSEPERTKPESSAVAVPAVPDDRPEGSPVPTSSPVREETSQPLQAAHAPAIIDVARNGAGETAPPLAIAGSEPRDEKPPEPSATASPAFGGATTFATDRFTPAMPPSAEVPVPMPVFAPVPQPSVFVPPPAPAPPAPIATLTGSPVRLKPQLTAPRRTLLVDPGASPARALPYVDRTAQRDRSGVRWKALGSVIAVLTVGVLTSRPYLQDAAAGREGSEGAPAVVSTPIPPATTGSLYIESQPAGAKVAIDGAEVGTTPLRLEQVAVGRHVVTVSTGTSTVRRSIRIDGGRELTLDIPVYSGWVAIFAPIRLQVSANGKTLGTTDSPRIMLAPGRHVLTLRNRELGFSMTKAVDIVPGEEHVLNLQPTGVVNVNALPWAEVWVDGARVGETPIAKLTVLIGTREFLFKHPEYGERRVTATVTTTGSAVSVDFTRPGNP